MEIIITTDDGTMLLYTLTDDVELSNLAQFVRQNLIYDVELTFEPMRFNPKQIIKFIELIKTLKEVNDYDN